MAGFDIPVDISRTLRLHAENIAMVVEEAAQIVRQDILDDVHRRAAENPRWVGVADYIDTWDENDMFWVGVREPAFVSEAFAAEYGTEDYPPSPILRTTDDAAREARNKARSHMSARLGVRYGL